MKYEILILKRAIKELRLLPKIEYERIKKQIFALAEQPRPNNCLKLSGREGWRIRSGNYRVIYEINDKLKSVTILHVGHRKYVYEK